MPQDKAYLAAQARERYHRLKVEDPDYIVWCRERSKAAYKARMASDPEFAASERAKKRAYQLKRRTESPEAYKTYHREWKRNHPPTPEQRKELAAKQLARYHADRGRHRDLARARKYGVSPADFASMLASQDGRCGICGTDNPTSKGWHVDHCHTTNKVRGLLCHYCNVGLGVFKDNPENFRRAIEYLDRAIGEKLDA